MIGIKDIHKITTQEIRDAFIVFLFILPMISLWLFPASLEARFTIVLFGYFPFYLLDVCYIIFPFLAKFKSNKGDIRKASYFLLFQFIAALLSFFINEYSDFRLVLWSNMHYFIAMFFTLFYPFSKYQVRIAVYCFSIAFIVLFAQLVLYSTGVLSAPIEIEHEYAGVARISTTVGAATGTGVIMFMLGGIVFYAFEKTKLKYWILLFWTISVFVTISRGPSLALVLFVIYFIYKEILNSHKKFRTIFRLAISFVFLTVLLNFSGFLAPLLERSSQSAGGDITSGRGEMVDMGVRIFSLYPVWGIGIGNAFCSKTLFDIDYVRTYPLAPHNYYILTLIEQGVVGFILFMLTLFFLLKQLPIRFCSLSAVLLITVLVLFNTEAIFVNSEFIFLLAFILNVCIYSGNPRFVESELRRCDT